MVTTSWFKRKMTRRRLTIAGLTLIVFALLLTFVPTYLARYFVAGTLKDFGIEYEGIKTVKVNIWKRELWVGPVRFRTGDAAPGKLGDLGVKLRIFPALKKHAMIERVIIRGIDINVVQQKDNTFTLNGISPNQFLSQAENESQQGDSTSKSWGMGLVDLDMENCRLLFTNKTGGTLTLLIKSLKLDNFASWQPDDPGTISLKALLNDVAVDLTGQARPFADNITLNLEVKTRDVELAKVIAFTGPIGLDRVAGVYESTIRHAITLFDAGGLEGHSSGKISVKGADYASGDVFALTTKQADATVDARYRLSGKDDLQVDGQLQMGITDAAGNLSGENSFTIADAQIMLADFHIVRKADNDLKISVNPKIELQQATYSGRMQLSLDKLTEGLSFLQSLSTGQNIAEQKTGLESWAGDEVTLPKTDIEVASLSSTLPTFEINTTAGMVELNIVTDTDVSGIQAATTERNSSIESLHSQIDTFQLRSGQGKMALQLSGKTALAGYAMQGPLGKGSIKAIDFNEKIKLQIDQGDISLEGSAKAAVKDTDILVFKTSALPQASVNVGSLNTEINHVEFSMANKRQKWRAEGGTIIDQAVMKYTEGENTRTQFDRLELRSASVDQNLNIGAEALIVSGLKGLVTRQFIDGVSAYPEKVDKSNNKQSDQKADSVTTKQIKRDVIIGQLALDKGAYLRFRDKQVVPPVIVDLDIKRAEVTNIDTTKPTEEAHANLNAKINEFTNFELQGKATAMGPQMNMTLNGKLDNLTLPPFSSYAAEFGGVYLDKGQLSTDVNLTANKGELDGMINLNIRQLEFSALSDADAKRLSEKAGMPISTAANLLQDRHGNIELSLPVSGTVTDPDVDISSAISKAVSKTLISIYPPTLVLSILASSLEGGGMTIEPINFQPGSSELDSAAKQNLNELVSLTQDRPRLLLNLCGRATPEDFAELTQQSLTLPPEPKPADTERRTNLIKKHRQQLLELATERGREVQRYLIKDKGLSANQVGSCRPVFDPDDSGPPRVTITL